VAKLSGFPAKSVEKLLADARATFASLDLVLLAQAHGLASFIIPQLLASGAPRVRTAGPVRRGHELVDELTLVVEGLDVPAIAAVIEPRGEQAALAIASRDERSIVAKPPARLGPPLRVVTADATTFLETLVRETGSHVHVRALEARARERGTSLAAACAAVATEEDLYASLEVAFVPAELREEGLIVPPRGLLPIRGVQGIFHVHTTWSDGTASIVEMARAASEAGFEYVGISDHSRAAVYANGLDPARLASQGAEVEAARRELPDLTILHGVEVDVLEDGSLDLPDDALAPLDFVVASLHTHFALDVATQTRRIVRALGHPLVTILGHPTGRLLLGRPGYGFDLDEVATAAAATGVFLEINASPQRLDLAPDMIRRAAELGARFCINPDAHEPRGFADVPLGVAQARRAALRSDQVLNSQGVDDIVETLRARRSQGLARLGPS
jgi:DNA polymerase (family 10)